MTFHTYYQYLVPDIDYLDNMAKVFSKKYIEIDKQKQGTLLCEDTKQLIQYSTHDNTSCHNYLGYAC